MVDLDDRDQQAAHDDENYQDDDPDNPCNDVDPLRSVLEPGSDLVRERLAALTAVASAETHVPNLLIKWKL
jgi:hypothetical protein